MSTVLVSGDVEPMNDSQATILYSGEPQQSLPDMDATIAVYPAPIAAAASSQEKREPPAFNLQDFIVVNDEKQPLLIRSLAMQRIETALVGYNHCATEIIMNMRVRLFQINATLLSANLHNEYGSNLMKNTRCLSDAIVYADGYEDERIMRLRIRNWIASVVPIRASSIEGVTATAGTSSASDLYVVKAPRKPQINLIHEAVIGYYVTNKLRSYIPNFMYVYAVFRCSPPVFDEKELVTWCTGKTEVNYLLLENISPAEPLNKAVATLTPEQFLTIYLQVLNAENIAYKDSDFTHYDLHPGNILIKKLNTSGAIPYYGEGTINDKPHYLLTTHLALIIDYGFAHAVINKQPIGKFGAEAAGVKYNSSFPMCDAYKLLCFSAEYANGYGNNTLFAYLENLFLFFQEGALRDRIRRRLISPLDRYNPEERHRGTTFDTLLRFIGRPGFIHDEIPPNIIVLPIPEGVGLTVNQFIRRFFLEEEPPLTLFEYCDALRTISHTIISPEMRDRLVAWLNERFSAEKVYLEEEKSIGEGLEEIASEMRLGMAKIIPVLKEDAKSVDIFSFGYVKKYREIIYHLFSIVDHIANIDMGINSSICALTSQKTIRNHRATLHAFTQRLELIKKWMEAQKIILRQNGIYIRYFDFKQLQQRGTSKGVIEFYRDEHTAFISAS